MSTRGISIPIEMSISVSGRAGRGGNNTADEDSPNSVMPALAYRSRNVMPTDAGYHSAFQPMPIKRQLESQPHPYKYTTLLERSGWSGPLEEPEDYGLVKAVDIQKVVTIEADTGYTVYVILAEQGILLSGQATPELADAPEYDAMYVLVTALETDGGSRRLWTTAILDGVLYAYRQGSDVVYIIGERIIIHKFTDPEYDYKVIRDGEMRFGIEDSPYYEDPEQQYPSLGDGLAIMTAKPKFINVKEQMGIFKAGNRLGFWDSDNSIAWSSPLEKLNFTPDATTFAGLTKFTDVTGTIIMILPHGPGFIVYSTGSITGVMPLAEGAERWQAKSILSSAGVQFDSQVTVSNPDTIHYARATSGFYVIENLKPTQIFHELFDDMRHTGSLVRLDAFAGRYLCISMSNKWEDRRVNKDILMQELNGKPFYTLAPQELPIGGYEGSLWDDFLLGRLPSSIFPLDPDGWELEAEDTDDTMPLLPLKDAKPLIPFYTCTVYKTPDRVAAFLANPEDKLQKVITSKTIPSQVVSQFPHVTITPDPAANNPINPMHYNAYVDPMIDWDTWDMLGVPESWGFVPATRHNSVLDKAGLEFTELLQESLDAFTSDVSRVRSLINNATDKGMVPATSAPGNPSSWDSDNGNAYHNGWVWNPMVKTPPEVCITTKPATEMSIWTTKTAEEITDLLFEHEELTEPTYFIRRAENITPLAPITNLLKVEWNGCILTIKARLGKMGSGVIFGFADTEPFDYYRTYEEITDECYTPVDHERIQTNPGDPDPNYIYEWRAQIAGQAVQSRQYPQEFWDHTDDEMIAALKEEDGSTASKDSWVVIFAAEITGLGYEERVSDTWTRYRKSISKKPRVETAPDGSRVCKLADDPIKQDITPADLDRELPLELENSWLEQTPDGLDSYPDPSESVIDLGNVAQRGGAWSMPMPYWGAAYVTKGTRHPYYPIYTKTLVWDEGFKKWGSFDEPHSCLFPSDPIGMATGIAGGMEALPLDNYSNAYSPSSGGHSALVNHAYPFGFVPRFSEPFRAVGEAPYDEEYEWESVWHAEYQYPFGNLGVEENPMYFALPHQHNKMLCLLGIVGSQGYLEYSDIALSRDGYTKMVGLDCYGITSMATVEVKGAYTRHSYGSMEMYQYKDTSHQPYMEIEHPEINPYLNAAADLEMTGRNEDINELRIPFAITAKHFRVVVAGKFDIRSLFLYGQPVGGVRYYAPPQGGW